MSCVQTIIVKAVLRYSSLRGRAAVEPGFSNEGKALNTERLQARDKKEFYIWASWSIAFNGWKTASVAKAQPAAAKAHAGLAQERSVATSDPAADDDQGIPGIRTNPRRTPRPSYVEPDNRKTMGGMSRKKKGEYKEGDSQDS